MKKLLLASLFTLSTTLTFTPKANATVIVEGQQSNGFYWQLVARKDGRMMWICRSTHDNRFQKHSSCQAAGAEKPSR